MEPSRLWLVDDEPSTGTSHSAEQSAEPAVLMDDAALPSPGRALREQRERRGMTVDDLSFATKIPRSSVEALEGDSYEGLPGPVFVKGFLRSCARAVGMNPETVLDLFYERERELMRSRRREPWPEIPAKSIRLGGRRQRHAEVDDEQEEHRQPGLRQWWASFQQRVPAVTILLWFALVVLMAALVVLAFSVTQGFALRAPT